MPIIIKEIHVKTTVEKRPSEGRLSEEAIAAVKRRVLREIADSGLVANKKNRKDR